jgi:hypothetical protein
MFVVLHPGPNAELRRSDMFCCLAMHLRARVLLLANPCWNDSRNQWLWFSSLPRF